MKIKLLYYSLFIVLFSCQSPQGPQEISILSWNVQNCFNAESDGFEYPEYDPEKSDWDKKSFYLRLQKIAEALGPNEMIDADLIFLQEVENASVIESLLKEFMLKQGYFYYSVTQTPQAAINTAVISRIPPASLGILRFDKETEDLQLRDILEVKLNMGEDRLYIFANHWKSKRGGAKETEKYRIRSAVRIKKRIKKIREHEKNAYFILCGDFNENHDEFQRIRQDYQTALQINKTPAESKGIALVTDPAKTKTGEMVFYSPWHNQTRGSYYYKEEWETIDQFLLCPAFFKSGKFQYSNFQLLNVAPFVNEEGLPQSWIRWKKSGLSDHLPIMLSISYQDN